MRTFVRRGLAPMGMALFVCAVTSSASAERSLRVEADASTLARVRTAARSPRVVRDVDYERHARSVLARVSPFTASAKASLAMTSTERFGDGDAIVRFEQLHGGLPVIGRGAVVRMAENGTALVTAIDLEEDLPRDLAPSVSAAHAAGVASKLTPFSTTAADAHLVVWPLRGGGARLAYAVLPSVPAGLPAAPRVIVDAQSGKVLESRDLAVYAKAAVYRFNPTKTPTVENLDLAILPTGEKLNSEFMTSANCVDKKTVKKVNLFGFNSDMHVCDIEQTATADANGDFLYPSSDQPGAKESKEDAFSEVSMYYHASKAYEFFRALQGSPTAQVVIDKPLRVVANLQIPAGLSSGNFAMAADPNVALEPFSNAFYSPAGGQLGAIFSQLYGFKGGGLFFGQGPQRDYAYDGDVVYHELTHAVVDRTLKLGAWHIDSRGAIDAPGAMNEGLADYFSSAITGDPDVGEYASKDLASGQNVIRTLANSDKCPTQIVGEVHLDSTLFAGGLWQARASLAEGDRGKMDAALYKAMRTNPNNGDLGFDDLTKLFLATLKTDFPAGATALEAAMTSRGVLPSCERVLDFTGTPIKAFTNVTGGFAAPGLQSLGVEGLAPGMIQVHAKSATPSGKATVTFTTRSSAASQSPLGGGGTPFTPVVLAKAGKPITWTTASGEAKDDADVKADATKAGTTYTATIELAEGATDLYLQIANKGDSDGSYDNVTVQLEPSAATPDPGNGGQTAAPPAGSEASDDSGGCSTHARGVGGAGAPVTTGTALGLGLALAAALRRRRR